MHGFQSRATPLRSPFGFQSQHRAQPLVSWIRQQNKRASLSWVSDVIPFSVGYSVEHYEVVLIPRSTVGSSISPSWSGDSVLQQYAVNPRFPAASRKLVSDLPACCKWQKVDRRFCGIRSSVCPADHVPARPILIAWSHAALQNTIFSKPGYIYIWLNSVKLGTAIQNHIPPFSLWFCSSRNTPVVWNA